MFVGMERPTTPLKLALGRLRVSQAELSRRIGIDVVQVNRWCQGLFVPVDETKARIAEALGCTVDELWPAHDPEVSALTDTADTERRPELDEAA